MAFICSKVLQANKPLDIWENIPHIDYLADGFNPFFPPPYTNTGLQVNRLC